ncbi:hypothetical protein C8A00DRAFT_41683 [Chaetomidium leptoderma]|uniref:HNH nuclease domain-containing protein n=1 Tax=Chaetomidium leptoderma TaxID=669021 RepID=A0AAN6VQ66_9PEZI|nr:hypothetical protein C8A00DRAFT_41683 [Chaetomidium leptoderma]
MDVPFGKASPSPSSPLDAGQRTQARRKFYHILRHFEGAGPHAGDKPEDDTKGNSQYSRPLLVRLTYEYARSEASQDVFLRTFFGSLALSLDGHDHDVDFGNEYLLDNFFLPLKASTKKTPQPSPADHSAVQRTHGAGLPQGLAGTPERLSALRGACLVRDRHRCVISRKFDLSEAVKRFKTSGSASRDDDGQLLEDDVNHFDVLKVAHILPHSLTKTESGSQLAPRLTLTHLLHSTFGDFQVFFVPVTNNQGPHTYCINSFLPPFIIRDPSLPITRTLCLAENRTIDPPSARLLAIHCAIAHILHLSGAGEYIDRILRDAEEHGIRVDGSTELGRLVKLGLGEWVDGVGIRT